jgi:hypothetical protein
MRDYLCRSLYQVNTRVSITELARRLHREATLDDIPDSELERFARMGFDWIWLLSVWQIGQASRRVSLGSAELRREFQQTLPDLQEQDMQGSGFAITEYTVHHFLGGDAALARLRERLRQHGLRLMLDFVPNHTALDHAWVEEHPEYYVRGTEADLARAPRNYTRVRRRSGDLLLAHGRDPYFPGWSDTLQLNYGNQELQEAMIDQLAKIARQCDGVRCDMAMLVLPEVFERTWGLRAAEFWPNAIQRVRQQSPDFSFMAEVYWDLEWHMLQLGFDYAYDKRLYDRLREKQAEPVREHFLAGLDYQHKLARFLENHDEPRAAAALPPQIHRAASVVTFLAPGLRFFHQGQFEGRLKRISPHLVRAPEEPVDESLRRFYDRLLSLLRLKVLRSGQWQLLECVPAWDGNSSCEAFIVYYWQNLGDDRLLIAVNYADHASQCYVRLPFTDLGGQVWRLSDQLGDANYERDGRDLLARGLYLDMKAWHYHVFAMSANESRGEVRSSKA